MDTDRDSNSNSGSCANSNFNTGLFAGGEMADEDMREMVDAIQEAYLIAKKNNKKYTPKKYRKDE